MDCHGKPSKGFRRIHSGSRNVGGAVKAVPRIPESYQKDQEVIGAVMDGKLLTQMVQKDVARSAISRNSFSHQIAGAVNIVQYCRSGSRDLTRSLVPFKL
jgi:hypothetical protein